MSRKRWAYVLFAVSAVGYVVSLLLMFAPRIPVWMPAEMAITTLAAGWGLALIAPKRFGRWPAVYMSVTSPVVALMGLYATQLVARVSP
jgi:hypothetical protein